MTKMTFVMYACVFLLQVLTLPLRVGGLFGLRSLIKRVFPSLMYKITLTYNVKMKEHKKELFRNLDKFYPATGPLRILEVGCGSGANFEHYPTGSRITCTDPNPHFRKYLEQTMKKNDHLVYESFVVASGENLRPVGDSCVDVVVCTLVLCSVKDTSQVLQEAKRILRPGGSLFFLEHVVSEPSSWIYFFQHVFQPLWGFICDGCETTRATWKDLEEARFTELQLSHIQAPVGHLIQPHIIGYAIK